MLLIEETLVDVLAPAAGPLFEGDGRLPVLATLEVDRKVDDDAVEPGVEARLALELVDVLDRP